MSDCIVPVNNSFEIALRMYKLDLEPLSLKLKKNREAHVDYLKQTKEHADTLCDIVEQARAQQPLDSTLDYDCKFTTHIQELLVYVNATCPSSLNKNEKLVTIPPLNKSKKVRLAEPRVKTSTSTSESKPLGNTKKNRISFGKSSKQKDWKSMGKVFINVEHRWIPTRWTFTIDGTKCLLTRITFTTVVPPKKPVPAKVVKKTPPSRNKLEKPKATTSVSSSSMSYRSSSGYGDYHIGNVTISRVYYVEGLGHSLFSVGQFCDSNLEVAFRKHTCFVLDLEGVDLLTGSRGINLYTLSLEYMMKSSLICLLSKASKTKSWLLHRRLSHLNFGTINELAKQGFMRGLSKLKYAKDYLCHVCSLGKSKKHTHRPKSKDSIQEKLYLLHMDLCGPMRIESINGKKYILVIVDDYSGFTWVKFLRSKDETPEFVIKFLKQVQVHLNRIVKNIRTDNGTEFVNQTLKTYYEDVGISHQTSVVRTSQQNGVVKRRYQTLVEHARTMLIFSKAPLYLWAEAVATTCYT
ncbi:retrovirus-related pol polyprotein from transposon TNT 1-94 [Tanacetum coccineum]|uniref:Retrovirus-related pol polyprotein from transposon TNT 1-94 n=1 Tax=Tanacetum coccineum TaxID=301880 RepID=A0ABQ5F1J9_9ASTR